MITLKKQLIGIENGRNFRELGGYQTLQGKKIKFHKLIRSGHLGDLSSADREQLTAYGVHYDLDFRTKQEVIEKPDRVPEGAIYEFDPVFSDDLTNASKGVGEVDIWAKNDPDFGFQHMLKAYDDMIQGDSAQKAYRRFFTLLLENDQEDQSMLFHCTAGKDRTGFAAFILLSALQVPLKTIQADYLLTNEVTQDFIAFKLAQGKADGVNANVLQSIKDIQSVHAAYLDHALATVKAQYGGIDAYLQKAMQLSKEDLHDLRELYLTD